MTTPDPSTNPFDAAVDHLLDVGWCSDGSYGDNGEKCVMLALTSVAADFETLRVADAAIADVLKSWGYNHRGAATTGARFNDEPSTTFADIQLLCKHAAARYDELVAS